MIKVAIIGGGISGLSTAYYLAQRGIDATIFESRARLGGVIHTEHIEGCTLEAGPDSFLSAKPAAMELIRELGLEDQVIGSNDFSRKTYVWKRGRLLPLPDGLMMMVPTKIAPLVTTRLLGWATKTRMALELLRAARRHNGDQSVADFIAQHYGSEAVDYLAEPLLSGIYGGDPRELSVTSVLPRFVSLAEKYGSLTRGVLAERAKAGANHGAGPPLFRTLKGGMEQLVEALVAAIRGRVTVRQARVEAVERAERGFRVRAGGEWLGAERVVLACEAHNGSAVIRTLDGRLSELLASIPYSSSMTVALGFDRKLLRGKGPAGAAPGHGFLVPKKERRRVMACTWVGEKFPYRVPEDKVVARCFLGGIDDGAVLSESDQAVSEIVRRELREIAGIDAAPLFVRIHRWPRSMAQYTVGHSHRLAEIQARVKAIPGFEVGGNAYEGIGIPDCIRMGKRAAEGCSI
ncbi:MAG: protoporphyrinogen oxidase [Acidobacteriia bacterium]|nr:protoporphyrinogen oxidase [Terriglobia bacterium]